MIESQRSNERQQDLIAKIRPVLQQVEERFSASQLDLGDLADVVGFGEISSVLRLHKFPNLVVKRLPIFTTIEQAENYLACYREYLTELAAAGVQVAQAGETIVESEQSVSLYCLQPAFNPLNVGSMALKSANSDQQRDMLTRIFERIDGLFQCNDQNQRLKLSLDGQLSNWVIEKNRVVYIDTSTPLLRKGGIEQLEYELLLTSTPALLRPVIRMLFLQDVLDRYFDRRLVYLDFVANLHKEGLSAQIPLAISLSEKYLTKPITEKEVSAYYREDKFIWQLFLVFRKIDRWLHRVVWRKPYQYILPEKVTR